MKIKNLEEYTFRLSGSMGCEILGPNGTVVAWTVDETMAMVIVALLNKAKR